MKNFGIDINADVGEGVGNESELMPYISSCNIACGGHAGDTSTMTEVVKLAKQHHIKIGAHPSFPDTLNFGRVNVNMSSRDLYNSLKQQINALLTVLHTEKADLHHLKPHGALYNLAAKDKKTAKVVIDVIKGIKMPIELYVPFNSVIAELAKLENIPMTFEAFADRNYNDDLSLVSRQNENAILHEKEAILKHVLNIIKHQKVTSINGVELTLKASTICVHGDTKNALEIIKYLSDNLKAKGIQIH
ncbi:5-oxoprolinase subunit PxpA [Winogradskyella bathintestinalis]|uniref:5-oxoprolinase subunit PxpA n=1 Tax=Winogradskyella bathintestinalis TaxID=3035208 RepID=A0ABT7ZVG3_9FLAO|nr:5-oxoprolinase subunit PxpA [Winogradskyella bathintestinalis]MDN3492981.1 5-oxoprolinase subunit PxpA [Winogradskyella bathintestinalis]